MATIWPSVTIVEVPSAVVVDVIRTTGSTKVWMLLPSYRSTGAVATSAPGVFETAVGVFVMLFSWKPAVVARFSEPAVGG